HLATPPRPPPPPRSPYTTLFRSRPERHPAGDALGQADDVGIDAPVLDRVHLASAAHAGLHLVNDQQHPVAIAQFAQRGQKAGGRDRKSTRLNSSHGSISYAVFCL